jgi:hypothetical protein
MASTSSLGPSTLLSYGSPSRQFPDFGFRLISGHESVRIPSFRRFRVHCESKARSNSSLCFVIFNNCNLAFGFLELDYKVLRFTFETSQFEEEVIIIC